MVSDISILSRFEMVKIIHGIDQPPKKPFLVISCFGNSVHMLINNNGEYTPNTLIHGRKIDNLKTLGMVDFVNVFCDDVTPESIADLEIAHPNTYLTKLYDEQNAIEVIEFFDKYKNGDYSLIIHCDAGISRSSAHAVFFGKELGIDISKFPHYIRPNSHILKVLAEVRAKNNK